jgi:hypothetical protein
MQLSYLSRLMTEIAADVSFERTPKIDAFELQFSTGHNDADLLRSEHHSL